MIEPDSNSSQLRMANKSLRYSIKPMLRFIPSQPVLNWLKHAQAKLQGITYKNATSKWITLGGVDVLRIVPNTVKHPKAAMLYFHGGAYVLGSPTSSQDEAHRLAISAGMTVYSVKYTSALSAPYPAAVNDGEAVFQALTADGVAPSQIVLTGTSAGGGLVLALIHRFLKKGAPLPACVISLSPWLDLTMSSPSIDTLAKREAILSRAWITRAAKMYAGGTALTDPEVSPGQGSYQDSPPHLVFYSRAEIFKDEVEAFVTKLGRENVAVDVGVSNHAPHAWPTLVDKAPESEAAFEMIAAFSARHLS